MDMMSQRTTAHPSRTNPDQLFSSADASEISKTVLTFSTILPFASHAVAAEACLLLTQTVMRSLCRVHSLFGLLKDFLEKNARHPFASPLTRKTDCLPLLPVSRSEWTWFSFLGLRRRSWTFRHSNCSATSLDSYWKQHCCDWAVF